MIGGRRQVRNDADARLAERDLQELCGVTLLETLSKRKAALEDREVPAPSKTGKRWSLSSQTDDPSVYCPSFKKKTVTWTGDEAGPAPSGIGLSCRKGLKPEIPNQDSAFVLHVEDDFSIYGVFDGHGHDGHWVSDFVKEQLPKLILKDERFKTADMESMLRDCFKRVQEMLVTATLLDKVNARHSGTTATVVIHDHRAEKLTVAHAGDSRACMGRRAKGKPPIECLEATALTQDHKPELEEERARIERAGGRVQFDGYANHRVYAKNRGYPALNMSRALGDIVGHAEAGISCEPTIAEVQLSPEDHILLLCSDGVWEFIEPEKAMQAVCTFPPDRAALAAEALASEAWDSWIREEGGAVVDDITVLVVFLRPADDSKHQPVETFACFEGAGLTHLRPPESLLWGRAHARGGC